MSFMIILLLKWAFNQFFILVTQTNTVVFHKPEHWLINQNGWSKSISFQSKSKEFLIKITDNSKDFSTLQGLCFRNQ